MALPASEIKENLDFHIYDNRPFDLESFCDGLIDLTREYIIKDKQIYGYHARDPNIYVSMKLPENFNGKYPK